MAAKKVFDFGKLGSRIPTEAKADLLSLVGTHSQLKQSLAKLSAGPSIDWAHYKNTITSPNVVAFAQKAYEGFEYPRPADLASEKISKQRQEALVEAKVGVGLRFFSLFSFRAWFSTGVHTHTNTHTR